MRVGTMFLGRVEALEHESIQTKFFVLGIPLIPMASFYVVAEEYQGVRGQALADVHGASVLAGYLRILLPVGAVLAGVLGHVERSGSSWALCVVLSLGFLASMVFLGRLSEEERAKRSCLLRLLGTGVPPEYLQSDARDAQLTRLSAIYGLLDDTPWRDRLEAPDEVPADLLTLVYGLARHALEREAADALWPRIAAGEAKPLRQPDAARLAMDDEAPASEPAKKPKARRKARRAARVVQDGPACPACDTVSGEDATFCKGCGEPLGALV
ncbi:MAG: hypothetical protein KC731_00825 [Myxococcales bacterium]|nr:hypothetical protein [Myxococcales bacterium]